MRGPDWLKPYYMNMGDLKITKFYKILIYLIISYLMIYKILLWSIVHLMIKHGLVGARLHSVSKCGVLDLLKLCNTRWDRCRTPLHQTGD